MSRTVRLTLSAVALVLGLARPASAGPMIHEDFNSGLSNPQLAGYQNFTVAGGVIRRNGALSDVNDRQYIRTSASDYNLQDFTYEVTFTTTALPQTSINFIGIGSGDRRPGSEFGHNEPWDSLFFRIHAPNVDGGFVSISNLAASNLVALGAIPNAGTHRARIQKTGSAITFSIDADYDGTFDSDMTHAFPNMIAVAPFLDATNSRLFFGTTFPDDSFDDMTVVPEPSTFLTTLLGIVGLLSLEAARRRQ
jgi:hypothetical protein